ncbi:hypothetical protein LCGC14_1573360, partial [marine sediment metagenome]
MNFLKQNLFLVCTVAVLALASAILLTLAGSANKKGDDYVSKRTEVALSMGRLMQGQGVNKNVVHVAEDRVKRMRQTHADVAAAFLARNSRNYQVMVFPDPDSPGKKVIPAFPIDKDLYQKKGLYLQFPGAYRKEVLKLLASMNPTIPPTIEEIKLEAATIAQQDARKAAAAPVVPAGDNVRIAEGAMPPRAGVRRFNVTRSLTPGVAGAAGTGTEEVQELPETPEEKATRTLRWIKAGAGDIFADEQSMHMALISDTLNYTNDMLWLAQLSLWVQRDIVAAINDTNAQVRRARAVSVQRAGAVKDKGVPASAVKRLVFTAVHGYVVDLSGGTEVPVGRGAPDASMGRARLAYVGQTPGAVGGSPFGARAG